MKRSLIVILTFVFVLSIAGVAFAASPFEDIPANHWSYEAVNKLAQTGIVSGYGYGDFRGDRTLTRYQMATFVANAMTKTDKATDEQKVIIDKLTEEFTTELGMLNVHLTKPENKAGKEDKAGKEANKIKLSGEVRYRYEWTKNNAQSPNTFTRVRVNLFAPLTDTLIFSGRIEGENAIGTKSDVNIPQAFIAGKALGLDTFVLGRIPLSLGYGMLSGIGAEGSAHNGADGIVLGVGKRLKFTVAAGKAGSDMDHTLNLHAANLSYDINKDLSMAAAHLADKDSEMYKNTSIGLKYKGFQDVDITGEYGVNNSDWAKTFNGGNSNAWYITTKYRGANPTQEGSNGFWIGYRNADIGFDPLSLGNMEGSALQKNMTTPFDALVMSNIKGFEYGYERTVFKNAIMSLQYNDLTKKDDGTSAKSFLCSLTYSF